MTDKTITKLIASFTKANPDFDIKNFPFSNPELLKTLTWPKDQPEAKMLESLKSMHRLARLTDNLSTAEALYDVNIYSAAHIATLPKQKFINQYKHCFTANGQSSEQQAAQIHQRATHVHRHSNFVALNAMPKPYYRSTRFYHTPQETTDFYQQMPSYQDLFGSLDYCACQDCQSVLSPAAYFVDLMRLVTDDITQPSGDLSGLSLQSRRPDLWAIPLDCENTNRKVPYLELVNNILIQTIQNGAYGETQDDNSYLTLANAVYPFNLPSNLPLDNLRSYLKQCRVTLPEIYRLFKVDDSQLSREMLGLSIEKCNLIQTEDTNEADLKTDYGLTDAQDLSLLESVPTFIQQTSITRQQLEDLIYQNLSSAELATVTLSNRFFINQGLPVDQGESAGMIQIHTDPDTGAETLTNINDDTLDKLHRFIRLADQLAWGSADLDWALQTTAASVNGKGVPINNLAIHNLARLNAFHRRYQTPIDVLCSFFADIKTTGQGNGTVSQGLFDRIFNQPIAFNDFSDQGKTIPYYDVDSLAPPYHPQYPDPDSALANPLYNDTTLNWTYSSDTGDDQQYRSHLLAALQISDTDLDLILQHGSANKLINPDNIINLNVPNLTQLYRFSQAAKIFKQSVMENVLLHDVLNLNLITSINDLCTLEEWVGWLKKCPLSIYQVHYLINYPFTQEVFLSPGSFITKSQTVDTDIDATQSVEIFNQLLENKFITMTGVVLNKQPLTTGNLQEAFGNKLNDDQTTWVQSVLLRYYQFQYNPVNATDLSIKQINVGYDRDSVLPLVNTLQESADEVLLRTDSFCSDDTGADEKISLVQSQKIFALLVEAEIITEEGIVVHHVDSIFDHLKPRIDLLKLNLADNFVVKRSWIKNVLKQYLILQTNLVQEKLTDFFDSPVERFSQLRQFLSYSLPSALAFTGEPDCYISVEEGDSFSLPDEFTIDLWMNVSQFNKTNQVILKQENKFWFCRHHDDKNTLAFGINTQEGTPDIKFTYPDDQAWHHVTVTYDGNNLQAYVDGITKSSKPIGQPLAHSNGKIYLGHNPDQKESNFKGQLAQIRIWKGIQAGPQLMYDKTYQADDLQACWLLTSGYGRIAYNTAGERYNGMIVQETPRWHNYHFNHLLASLKKSTERNNEKSVEENKAVELDIQLLFSQLAKHNNLMQWLTLDAEVMETLINIPSSFGLAGIAYNFSYTPELIRNLDAYRSFSIEFKDNNNKLLNYFSTESPNEDVKQSKQIQLLALITGWDEAEIYTLETSLQGNYDFNAITGVTVLRQCFHMARRLNIQAQQLLNLSNLNDKKAIQNNWPLYDKTVTDTLQTTTAVATDQNKTQTDFIRQKAIQENERNLLTGYLLAQINQVFDDIKTLDDLYAFLLVDVKMSGSTMISPIILGLNSLQLYIQRCQLSLEQGVTYSIPERQWQWMQSYPIWRANRQVYLYPENYIDPSLRRVKTPLYKTLQDELLQGDVDEATINTAFGNYVDGLASIANMEIVDAYYCQLEKDVKDKKIDKLGGETIFLFAKSPSEANTFYHRSLTLCGGQDDKDKSKSSHYYSPWKKIDVTINAETLSGIYAFDKLFVFWVEQQDKQLDDSDQNRYTITTATIKYAFQTSAGKWSSPQTLAQDVVIFASGQKKVYKEYRTNLIGFGYTDDGQYLYYPMWKKVRLMFANPSDQNYIFIEYGQTVLSDGVKKPSDSPDSTGLKEVDAFNTMLYLAATNAYNIADSADLQYTGLLSVFALSQDLAVNDYTLDYSPGNLYANLIQYGCFWHPELTDLEVKFPSYTELSAYWSFNGTYRSTIGSHSASPHNSDDCEFVSGTNDPLGYVRVLSNKNSKNYLRFGSTANFSIYNSSYSSMGIDLWFNQQSATNGAYIISKPEEWFLQINNVDKTKRQLKFRVYYNNGQHYFSVATDPIVTPCLDKHWHHVKIQLSYTSDTIAVSLVLDDGSPRQNHNGHSLSGTQSYSNYDIELCANTTATQQGSKNTFIGYYSGLSILLSDQQLTSDSTFDNIAPPYYYVNQSQNGLCQSDSGKVFKVRNRPNTACYSTKDDTFLIIPTIDLIEDLSQWRRVSIKDRYLVVADRVGSGSSIIDQVAGQQTQFQFIRLSTSVVNQLQRKLRVGGARQLLTLQSQQAPELDFNRYQPNEQLIISPKNNNLNFDGAYGEYFWELFFQVPFLIANQLNANDKFDLAKQWYEFIYNPTDDTDCWRFLPLQSVTQNSLEETLTNPALLAIYDNDPFDPDTLARLQPGSYEKAIVMRYIDNLIQWGDALFARYTWESNTEATLLYVLADDLLGDEPQMIEDSGPIQPQTFTDLEKDNPNGIPQFLIDLEVAPMPTGYRYNAGGDPVQPFNLFQDDYYFCIGENQQLLHYWQITDDRLYKLRHGMNIEGQEQPLPDYQELIDVNQFIGNSQSLLDGGVGRNSVPVVPYYRFDAILPVARNLANHVEQLGSALLSALEKQDAEQMSLLQATHEANVQSLMTQIKQDQIDQLIATEKSLQSALDNATLRYQTMDNWLDQGYSAYEISSLALTGSAIATLITAEIVKSFASGLYAVPTIYGFSNGGFNPGGGVTAAGNVLETTAAIFSHSSQIMSTVGQYERREDDWGLQRDLAANDIVQIQAQMEANNYALQAAQQDLVINQRNITYARKVEAFVKTKFTNKELYQWMTARLSTIYSQTYQLALNLAKMAETAYQYELSNRQQFINPMGWDALKKGLLAGESLSFDLDQMEVAYKSNNVRKLEIEKTISLRQLDPLQWENFRTKGICTFSLDEQLFDFDFPGHFNRTIKTISLNIPAVVGPYQSIQATLTQTSNRILLEPDIKGVKALLPGGGDGQQGTTGLPTSIRSNWCANQQVAITRGINDDGLFMLNFGDERYVPFEGTGAVSEWELSMPPASNPIDFNTITDVIVQLKYTATDGSKTLVEIEDDGTNKTTTFGKAVIDNLPNYSGYCYLSLSQAYPDAWYAFLNQSSHTLDFPVSRSLFPFNLQYEGSGLEVGNSQGQVALLPILAPDTNAKDKSELGITLNNNPWDNSNNLVLIQSGDQNPTPVPAKGLAWEIVANSIPADLLNSNSSINGTKWLDIMLVIPFDGSLFGTSSKTRKEQFVNDAEKTAPKIKEGVENAKPEGVQQNYADDILKTSWKVSDDKDHTYTVKIMDQKINRQVGCKTSKTMKCDFNIDEELSSSREGSYLIARVSTNLAGEENTAYVEADSGNYRLGRAEIGNLSYNDGTLTGNWKLPRPLRENPDHDATGYQYRIDGTDKVGTGDSSSSISITGLDLDPDNTYQLQIRATGGAGIIPGEWSKPQNFTTWPAGTMFIANFDDLQNMKSDLNKNYVLVANIDCKGKSFSPVGSESAPFKGSLNGNGFTINNLTIDTSGTDYVGLFGVSSGATFTGVGLLDVDITASTYVGALVGSGSHTTISGCYVTGQVTGYDSYVGGLVGLHSHSSNSNSCSTATVTASAGLQYIGGLVGSHYSGGITNSYATGNVTANTSGTVVECVGGLAGYNDAVNVNNCYATGNVAVTGSYTGNKVGGLVGGSTTGGNTYTMKNSYATGSVSGGDYVGGLVGKTWNGSNIVDCYAVGSVTGSSNTGGLVGYSSHSTISGSYYDKDTTNQSDSSGGTGESDQAMKTKTTFAGWRFGSGGDWVIKDGFDYPKLRWQEEMLGKIKGKITDVH